MEQAVQIAMAQRTNRLTELFAKEKERFLRFVRYRLFDLDPSEDAEDVFSEVVTGLFQRPDLLDDVENLSGYIYRSLSNRITDRRRKAVTTVSLDDADDHPIELPDKALRPDQSLAQQELRDALLKALDQLTAAERAIWIATEIDGRTFRELAAEWDEPIGTLLSRKSRATATLRGLLSDYRRPR